MHMWTPGAGVTPRSDSRGHSTGAGALGGKSTSKKKRKRKKRSSTKGRGPGEIDKGGKKEKKGLQQTKEKKHPLRHRERGALESAGPVAYATFATRLIRHCLESMFRL